MSHEFHAESVKSVRSPHSPHGSVRNVWGSVNYCAEAEKEIATYFKGVSLNEGKKGPSHNVMAEPFHGIPDPSFLHSFPNLLIQVIHLDPDFLNGCVGGGGGFHGRVLRAEGSWLLVVGC